VAGKIDPMHQFTVEPLVPLHIGKYDISLTNSAAWMLAALAVIWAFMALCMKRQLVPGRWQMAVEGLTGFIDDLVSVNIGPEGRKFTPFIFALFTFILFVNFLGMLPLAIVPGWHAFTPTSHFSITGVLAIVSFSLVLIVGFWRHGLHFFSLFLPAGTPIWMAPLIIPIEIVSFLSRPISLSVRLFANMLAGHTMLYVFGTFVIGLAAAGGVLSLISVAPLLAIIAVAALEFLIAFLQAYVFAILTCIYLNDALNLHDH